MSVLIKGMKIPKNCIQCEWHEEYGGDYDWCHACRLTGSMPIDNAETGRADDCPLETYEPCTDTISRQAAIDALKRLQKDISGDYTELDPMVMAGCGYIGDCIGEIQDLPSAQPEIVRCKDCEYGERDEVGRWFCSGLGCQIGNEDGSGFCSDAERRTDD